MDVLAHVAQYPQLRLEELTDSLLAADDSSWHNENERIERVHSALAMLSGTSAGSPSLTAAAVASGLALGSVPTPGLGALAHEPLGISSTPGAGAPSARPNIDVNNYIIYDVLPIQHTSK